MGRPGRSLMCVAGALCLSASTPAGDSLAVLDGGEWRTWWRADASPSQWLKPDPVLARALRWQPMQPGLDFAEVRIAARPPALRIRLILLRIDSRRFEWGLVEHRDADGKPAWQVDNVATDAAFAFNAGQFSNGVSWGWLVHAGNEQQPPQPGPLSMALTIDSGGNAHLTAFADIETIRSRDDIRWAFQSYPMLLEKNGVVPDALRDEGHRIDVRHRDSRLALGHLRDGRLIIVLTRFDVGGGLLRPVPIGPNTPEMAAIMGALGCARAVMLDGGISSQLLLRGRDGNVRTWDAYRSVPLGLIATPIGVGSASRR